MKNKNTLLYDFMKIYNSLECKGVKFTCLNCPNKIICDTVEDVIKSIGDLYNESK